MGSSLQLSLKLRVPSREHPHLGSVLQLDYPELINLQDISIFILYNNLLPKQTDVFSKAHLVWFITQFIKQWFSLSKKDKPKICKQFPQLMCCARESELPLSLSSLQHMRTAGETVEFFLCVCVTNDWIKSSPVESVCKCYTSHMSEPKLPARALHETGTPQRSARLPGICWTPAGGRLLTGRTK